MTVALISPPPEPEFRCDVCGKTYDTGVQLHGHQTTHREPEPCPECGKGYKFPNALSNHRLHVHGVSDGYVSPAMVKRSNKLGRPTKVASDQTWEVDDIFQAVLRLVFPNGAVPVEAVPTLVRWRDDTREMLETIRG